MGRHSHGGAQGHLVKGRAVHGRLVHLNLATLVVWWFGGLVGLGRISNGMWSHWWLGLVWIGLDLDLSGFLDLEFWETSPEPPNHRAPNHQPGK